jgi:GNAT superfamily N-acetyltransferase
MELSEGIRQQDKKRLEEILISTGYFYDFEIRTALELADETISMGMERSGYYWFKATEGNEVLAFANYGKNEFSTHSWELYWIAVHQDFRNRKIGKALLKAIEGKVKQAGGKILWIETSGRPLYAPTEEFYKRNGYVLQASLKDFYGPGDPKQIYARTL